MLKFFKRTHTLPFKFDIPSYSKFYLEQSNSITCFIKFFKRYIYILLKKQNHHEIFLIQKVHKKLLWINLSAPSLGDSLMDLSSRIMLEDKSIDLFTDIKNAHIYSDDRFFNKIYTKISEVDKLAYDLVILDSYSTKSIKVKAKVSPKTPYVGMFGYFNGPEVNRVLFSFHQMNNLLNYHKSKNDINILAKNSISISKEDYEIVNNLIYNNYITIALGGEWQYRTYNKWNKVLDLLLSHEKKLNVVLIGSTNAQKAATEIIYKFPQCNIFNFVSKLSFNQTAAIIKRSQILLCCDGGLMHAATAVNAKILPLFSRLSPEMQLTNAANAFPLFDANDVNNIPVQSIFLKYCEALNLYDSHP